MPFQVRTQTLVKNAIIQVDATPFKQWYQQHYGVEPGQKKRGAAAAPEAEVILSARSLCFGAYSSPVIVLVLRLIMPAISPRLPQLQDSIGHHLGSCTLLWPSTVLNCRC